LRIDCGMGKWVEVMRELGKIDETLIKVEMPKMFLTLLKCILILYWTTRFSIDCLWWRDVMHC